MSICLFFDCDFDNSLPSVLVTPSLAEIHLQSENTKYTMVKIIYEKSNNYQAINRIIFDKPIITNELKVVYRKKKKIPVSLYKIFRKNKLLNPDF